MVRQSGGGGHVASTLQASREISPHTATGVEVRCEYGVEVRWWLFHYAKSPSLESVFFFCKPKAECRFPLPLSWPLQSPTSINSVPRNCHSGDLKETREELFVDTIQFNLNKALQFCLWHSNVVRAKAHLHGTWILYWLIWICFRVWGLSRVNTGMHKPYGSRNRGGTCSHEINQYLGGAISHIIKGSHPTPTYTSHPPDLIFCKDPLRQISSCLLRAAM